MLKRLVFAVFISLTTVACSAETVPSGHGMYVCLTPVFASHFWDNVVTTHKNGVKITREVFSQIARGQKLSDGTPACTWLPASPNLKAVTYMPQQGCGYGGMLAITDGKQKGWAVTEYYIRYENNLEPARD